MNLLISRILLFLNSQHTDEVLTYIAKYILENYLDIEDVSMKQIAESCDVSTNQIRKFYTYFSFESWQDFKQELIRSREVRYKQQLLRFNHLDLSQYYNHLAYLMPENDYDIDAVKSLIQELIVDIHEAKVIHLFGAIYPLSLSVEFQTHMVSIGKPVIQWQDHSKYTHVNLDQDDIAFIFSASGRYITQCKQMFGDVYYSSTKKVLLTQSQDDNYLDRLDYFVSFPQTHDVFSYNYILVCILEIIYIEYCIKYRLYQE